MVAKRRRVPGPFDDAAINAMAHAFAVALHKPGHLTPETRPLDARQVVDKRGYVSPAQKREKILVKRGAMVGDGRVERPAPKTHPKQESAAGSAPPVKIRRKKKRKPPLPMFNQGRHDA